MTDDHLTKNGLIVHVGYEWSEDYALLVQLLGTGAVFGEVLCTVITDNARIMDPVRFRMSEYGVNYVASCRGITYFESESPDEFKALCAEYKVRFIVPHRIAKPEPGTVPELCEECGGNIADDQYQCGEGHHPHGPAHRQVRNQTALRGIMAALSARSPRQHAGKAVVARNALFPHDNVPGALVAARWLHDRHAQGRPC